MRFISTDDHVQEPPDLWLERLSGTKWGEKIPHIEEQKDGTERWVIGGQPSTLASVATAGALMADRAQEPQRWDEVPKAAYRATERLRSMDTAGIDYSVLYPTIAGVGGGTFGRLEDSELEQACVRAYNDWLIEEWAATSERFVPMCIVPIYPAEAAVAEIERSVANGHKGVIYPGAPNVLRDVPHINAAAYEPIWAKCEELGVPLCFHAGAASIWPSRPHLSPNRAKVLNTVLQAPSCSLYISNVLFSGMLLRHPRLKVVFAESSLGWGPQLLEYADFQFTQDRVDLDGFPLLPTEMFLRQCYLTGWYDSVATYLPYLGAERILWSANIPLPTSDWPNIRDSLELSFRGVSEDDRRQILWTNPAELFGIKEG